MELATRDPRCSKPKESLDLSYSTLTEFPLDLCRFHHLRDLRLDNNRLEDVPWQVLMKMPSLRFVNLSSNLISELPEILATWISVTVLDLSYNRIKKLSPRLWPLFFQTGTRSMVRESKGITRRLYTWDGVPLPEVVSWGEYYVGDCAFETGWCRRISISVVRNPDCRIYG